MQDDRSWTSYEEGLAQAEKVYDTAVARAFKAYEQTCQMVGELRADIARDQAIAEAYQRYRKAKLQFMGATRHLEMTPILRSLQEEAAQFLRICGGKDACIEFEVALACASYLFRNALTEALKVYEETWRLPTGEYQAGITRKAAIAQAWERFQAESGTALKAIVALHEDLAKQALYREAENSLRIGGEMPDRVRDNVSQIQEDLLGAQDALDGVQKTMDEDLLQKSMEDLEGSPFFEARKAMIDIQEFLGSTWEALDKLQGGMVIPEAQQSAEQARDAMKQALTAVVLLKRAGIGYPDKNLVEFTVWELGKAELVLKQAETDLGALEVGLEYSYMPGMSPWKAASSSSLSWK